MTNYDNHKVSVESYEKMKDGYLCRAAIICNPKEKVFKFVLDSTFRKHATCDSPQFYVEVTDCTDMQETRKELFSDWLPDAPHNDILSILSDCINLEEGRKQLGDIPTANDIQKCVIEIGNHNITGTYSNTPLS